MLFYFIFSFVVHLHYSFFKFGNLYKAKTELVTLLALFQQTMSGLLDSFTRIRPVDIPLPYDESLYLSLLDEFQIIHLVYHRNLNQHHVAKWWSDLDILRRHLRKVLLLIHDIDEIRTLRRLTGVQWNDGKKTFVKVFEVPKMTERSTFKGKKSTKRELKLKKHNQLDDVKAVELINGKLKLLFKEVRYLNKKCIQRCYWSFMGVIELGQFVNIGFTVVGALAKVFSLLKQFDDTGLNKPITEMERVEEMEVNNKKEVEEGKKDIESGRGFDIGEPIDIEGPAPIAQPIDGERPSTIESVTGQTSKKKKKSSAIEDIFGGTTKKKKKKKSKNTMDDIFGF